MPNRINQNAPSQILAIKPSGLVGAIAFAGSPKIVYLCDAGCRPNPGTHLPVVWDDSQFLDIPGSNGTNHRASYQAVIAALEDASQRQLSRIELQVTSDLVYKQLSTGAYCRNKTLAELRQAVVDRADRVKPVRIVLKNAPFLIGASTVLTRHALRRAASSFHASAASQPLAAPQTSHRSAHTVPARARVQARQGV